jgi:thiaminase
VSAVATHFSECLNAATQNSSDPDAVNALITSVFLEVSRFETEFYYAWRLGRREINDRT